MNKTMMAFFTVILGFISFWILGNESYAADSSIATQATSYVKETVEYYFDGDNLFEIVKEGAYNSYRCARNFRRAEAIISLLEANGIGASIATGGTYAVVILATYVSGEITDYIIEEYDIKGKLVNAFHVIYNEAGELVCDVIDNVKNADIPGKALACKDFVVDKGGKLCTVTIDGLKYMGEGAMFVGSKVVGLVH